MWDYSKIEVPTPYWGDETYRKAIDFLDGPGVLEDWGCGTCYAKQFVKQAQYIGVDSSPSRFNDVTETLSTRISRPEAILVRHVLEHNYNWKSILINALSSFQKRMALVIFTPFNGNSTVELAYHYDIGVPDLSFRKGDIIGMLPKYTEETVGPETIFYITHA